MVRGSGKFVPNEPWCDYVFSRILQRDKVNQYHWSFIALYGPAVVDCTVDHAYLNLNAKIG